MQTETLRFRLALCVSVDGEPMNNRVPEVTWCERGVPADDRQLCLCAHLQFLTSHNLALALTHLCNATFGTQPANTLHLTWLQHHQRQASLMTDGTSFRVSAENSLRKDQNHGMFPWK